MIFNPLKWILSFHISLLSTHCSTPLLLVSTVVASSCFILNLFQLVQREFLMICFAKRHAMHITRNTYVNCKPQRVKYTFDERAGKTFVNFGALGTNSLPNNPSLITDPILLCVILCVGRGVAMGLLLLQSYLAMYISNT